MTTSTSPSAREPAPSAPPTAKVPGQLGERRLTTVHAIGQSLAIGPIFSAGLLTGIVAGLAGFNTPASVLLASVGMIGLAYVISLYARRYAGAGAMYEYVARGGNRSVGVYAAGIYSVGLLFLGGGTVFIAIGYFANAFVVTHLSIHIPWWIWGAFGLFNCHRRQSLRRPCGDSRRPHPLPAFDDSVPDLGGRDHRPGRCWRKHAVGVQP